MAKLPVNYKDWVPDASGLQYRIGTTSLGNSSITDVTTYTQSGNEWQASILNSTNTEVNALMDRADASDAQIASVNTSLTAKIDSVNTSLTANISSVNTSLTSKINSNYNILNAKIDTTNAAQDKQIDALFDRVDHVRFRDGKFYTIQQIVYMLCELHKENPLTAKEFQELGLTAVQFRSFGISAFDYDTNGKSILHPIEILNPITAIEFQELGLTAEEFRDKGLTALEFKTNANTLLRER